jgi:hypothetical protein
MAKQSKESLQRSIDELDKIIGWHL